MTEITTGIIRIADYIPHPANYNRHPEIQIERMAASLQMFGQVRSVVVWRNYFLAGHGVREGALRIGWEELRADILPTEYPEELAIAYIAADNELARLSDPDQAQLAEILSNAAAYDDGLLQAIGYSDREFEKLLEDTAALIDQGIDESMIHGGIDAGDQYGVVVMCRNEAEQERTYNRLRDEGYDVKVVTV